MKTYLSVESNKEKTLTLVVSEGKRTIRHKLKLDELCHLSLFLAGHVGGLASKKG